MKLEALTLAQVPVLDSVIELYVPEPSAIELLYEAQQKLEPDTPFPYWAKLWPSAIALSNFLAANPQYVQHKMVLELAAGLGLPSLTAARYAKLVTCSDYLQEALDVMERSIRHNRIKNVSLQLLNWNHLPAGITADVLLLSDINYESAAFETLFLMLKQFIAQGTLIMLTTPQRLMAGPFVERLLPWCLHTEEIIVSSNKEQVAISLFVLKQ